MRDSGGLTHVSPLILNHFIIALLALQTDDIIVDELRGRNHVVPLTLIREKGTYGTVTVDFQVRGTGPFMKHTGPEPSPFQELRGEMLVTVNIFRSLKVPTRPSKT